MRKHLTGWTAFVVMFACGSVLADEPKLIFHLPFEEDATAVVAGGDPAPTADSKPGALVEGVRGQGMQLDDATLLRYQTAGNYNNARGTLEFCFKYLKPELKPNSESALFWEEGRNANRISAQRLRLPEENPFNRLFWRNNGYRLGNFGQQPIGEWNHVLLAWDAAVDTDLYLNGTKILYGKRSMRAGHRDLSGPRPITTNEFFTIGPRKLLEKIQDEIPGAVVVIDELRIYDRMFTEEEAQAAFHASFPVDMDINTRVFKVGHEKPVRVTLRNDTDKTINTEINWELADEDGQDTLQAGRGGAVTLPAGETVIVEIPVKIDAQGGYTFRIIYEGATRFSRNFIVCAVVPEDGVMPAAAEPELKLRLIKEFDCTADYGPEEFCDDGLSRVVDSPVGKYRATSAEKPWSRFAYRFFIDNPQTPHLAVVEYPDYREFEMEIMIDNRSNSLYQTLENGVIVGGHYPNTGDFKELRLLFWPTDEECTLMVMDWPIGGGDNNPRDVTPDDIHAAGARTIKIYEVVDGLPAAQFANLPEEGNRRTVGTREEDATSTREFGANCKHQSNGFTEIYRMLRRRMQYMNFVGQDLYSMTFVHYGGGFYPSTVMPRDLARSKMFPDFMFELALLLAEHHGIKINAGLHLREDEVLSALGDRSTREDIVAGRDTIYSIRHDGEHFGRGTLFAGPPNYNFMHPDVERHILDVVADILAQYGDFPAFNGFDFWFWSTMPMWFGNLENGYADMIIRQFEEETGIKVPGEIPDPTRFTQRYIFLVKTDETVKEQWIEWRCRKVTEFWMKIHELIQEYNPALVMNIEFWAIIKSHLHPNGIPNIWEPGDINSVYDYYRRGGIDLNMLKDIPNVYFGNVIMHSDNPQPKDYYVRDFVFDPAFVSAFTNYGFNAVWLEQRRREFDCMHSATPMPDYWLPEGTGSRYGEQPSRKAGPQNRVPYLGGHLEKSGSVMPNSDYYLEFYAKSLADWDVRQITDGGLNTTTLGAENELRDFIRAYRTLPAEYFAVFNNVDDPVCARFRQCDDGYYFYLVNREYYPASATLTLTGPTDTDAVPVLLDLPADAVVELTGTGARRTVKVNIGPYRLRAFKIPMGWALADVAIEIPAEHLEELRERKTALENLIATAKTQQMVLPRMVGNSLAWFEAELRQAWENGRYARLRKLLDSYWARHFTQQDRGDQVRMNAFLQESEYAAKYFTRAPIEWQAHRVAAIPPVDSPEWRKAQPMEDFASVLQVSEEKRYLAKPPERSTRVFCVYDDKQIGFLFECEEPAPELVMASHVRFDTDLLKLMLAPDQSGRSYYYYRIFFDNAGVYTSIVSGDGHGGSLRGAKRELDFTAEFKKKADRWLARIVIPYRALGVAASPQSGDVWRLNLVRQVRKEETNALRCERIYDPPRDWGVHAPDLFDKLIF